MTVSITLRSVKGGPLTSSEVDGNFTNLKAAVEALETDPPSPNEITNITASGSTLTIHLADGTTYPVTIPVRTATPPAVVTISTTTRTVVALDANTYARCTNASGCAITVPAGADLAVTIGTELHYRQSGAGAVTIAGAVGVTINVPTGYVAQTAVQGAVMTAKKVDADTWDVFGLLATP